MDVSPLHKDEIERRILLKVADGLEENKLTESELPSIADFVLANIDHATDHDKMIKFLDDLSSRWPVFENIEQMERGEVLEANEVKVEQEVFRLAKAGQVEDAIKLAKNFIGK